MHTFLHAFCFYKLQLCALHLNSMAALEGYLLPFFKNSNYILCQDNLAVSHASYELVYMQWLKIVL